VKRVVGLVQESWHRCEQFSHTPGPWPPNSDIPHRTGTDDQGMPNSETGVGR